MKLGLIGLPGSGKSTLFRLLTGHTTDRHGVDGIATVHLPDPRLDRIFEICRPKKMTYAELTVLDLLALKGGPPAEGELHLAKVAGEAEALVVVVRCFGELDHTGAPLNPRSDLETVLLEMALTDLGIVDGRLDRLRRKGSKREVHEEWELRVLERVREHLARGGAARELRLAEDEDKLLRGFALLTLKPLLVALNIGEDDAGAQRAAAAKQAAEEMGLATVTLCAELAEELAALPPGEQQEFLAAYGFAEPARERLLGALHGLLRTLTFFTVNENEARAWTIAAGATAPQAAGRVHSDMEHGFIRAEVTPFAALDEAGSMAEVKRRNLLRVEGRDYVVQEGDLLQMRFSR